MFVDAETTSLSERTLTVLECAWCITDMDGTQRLPLRSRFCQIGPPGESADVPNRPISGLQGAQWTIENGGDPGAKQMAVESGLYSDWLACPSRLRIDSGEELARLILDDLAAVCDPGDNDPDPERGRAPEHVHIAGAGAARFDFTILAQRCPGVTPRPGARQPTHYRPVDTSGNQTGLLGNNYERELIQWALKTYGNEAIVPIELGREPRYAYGNRDVYEWLTADVGRHRAAPDVARSIVAQRALWRYGQPLREALGGQS